MTTQTDRQVEQAYNQAKDVFAEVGVDADLAVRRLGQLSLSVHCCQGDDVDGFEAADELGRGLAVTGNYPGKARSADELRSDLQLAFRLIPGRHRVNLHAMYAEIQGKPIAPVL